MKILVCCVQKQNSNKQFAKQRLILPHSGQKDLHCSHIFFVHVDVNRSFTTGLCPEVNLQKPRKAISGETQDFDQVDRSMLTDEQNVSGTDDYSLR